jgi:hypothetical protein
MSLLLRPTSAIQELLPRPAPQVLRTRPGRLARWLARAAAPLVSIGGVDRRRLVGCMVAVSLAVLTVLAVPLLTGRVPVILDLGNYHLPVRDFYARCLAQGESFDWTPEWFCGFFLVGEGQLGGYHPVHMLLYRWLPLSTAFAAEVYLHCPLLLLGMYLFLRRHAGAVGGLMGAMLFTFSLRYFSHLQHPNLAAVLAHIPWLLWTMDVAVTSPGPKRKLACAGISFLTASQILLGHPQAFWFSLLTVAAYAVYLLTHQRPCAAAWVAVVAGHALGFLMGAVQLLASYSAFSDSTRADATSDYAFLYALPPKATVGMVAPYLKWGYLGAVPLMLLLWWATAGRAHRPRQLAAQPGGSAPNTGDPRAPARTADRLALAALVFALLTLLLAFGRLGGLYYLQTYLPVVGRFRAPARYLTLTQLGVAVASAVAFGRLVTWVSQGKKTSCRHLVLPWVAVLAAVLVVACRPSVTSAIVTESAADRSLYYFGPVIMLAAAVALTAATRGRQLGLFALVLIAAADVGVVALARGHGKELWYKRPRLEKWVAALTGPPGPCPGRIYEDGFYSNASVLRGCRMANGYSAMDPRKQLDYHDSAALRVAGVAWYRADPFRPETKTTGLGPPVSRYWYRVPHPLPRARLVSRTVASHRPGDDLKQIDLETTAVVSRAVELPSGPPGSALIVTDRPGQISLEVDAPGRRLLVVSESYHSGWRARVDGMPVELLRVNGDFIGCVVEEGSHQVELIFRPVALVCGKALSLAGLAIGLCICTSAVPWRFVVPPANKS